MLVAVVRTRPRPARSAPKPAHNSLKDFWAPFGSAAELHPADVRPWLAVYLWGVDIGEAKLDLAAEPLAGGPTQFFHMPAEGKRSPERFAELGPRVRRFCRPIAERATPSVIVVERPVGRFPNPWLTGAWAVILGAMTYFECPVWTFDAKEWRAFLKIKGGGNAKKEDVIAWAQAQGIVVADDHQADAAGLVRFARGKLQADVELLSRLTG